MSKRKTTEQVIEEFTLLFGDRWDYSKVDYVDANTPLLIICREHGEFYQISNNHKRGHIGCGECSGRGRSSTENFIQESVVKNGYRWDYSKTVYRNNHAKVTIVCREHGPFLQHPRSHIRGHVGCPLCNRWEISAAQFSEDGAALYDSKYDYSKTVLGGMRDKVVITCPDHGDFSQVADSHVRGFVGCTGCQSTGTSQGEEEMATFIEELGLTVKRNVRGLLPNPKQEVDVYVPELRVGVEFNGLYYHSQKFKENSYHFQKYEDALGAGIRLIQVWEDDWTLKKGIVTEHLRQVLGESCLPKINARDTEVREVNSTEARQFLNSNHIQGYIGASIQLGLYYEGSLVALASLRRRGSDYDLVRYATSSNVRGGHSKIVAHVERNFTYDKLVTFADRTYTHGGLYRTTGWVEGEVLRPDYFYLFRGVRYHKFNFRIKRFRDDPTLKYEEGMTERQLAQLNGLLRVYDAGKIRFTKPHPDLV